MRSVTQEGDAPVQPSGLTLTRTAEQLARVVPLIPGQEEIPELKIKLRPVDPPPEAA